MSLSFIMSCLKNKGLVAIDWSDRFLRIVSLKKRADGQYELAVADSEELEVSFIENNQIVDFAGVAESLLELLRRNKIRQKKVVFVLNGTNVISKRLRFDDGLTETQIHDEIILDFNKYVSYPVEETFYDFELQKKSEATNTTKQEVVFIASHKDQIEQYLQLAKICRLTIEVIDIDSHVLQRYIEIFFPQEKTKCWALICLNYKRFKLHILDNNEIYVAEHKSISAGMSEGEYLNTLSAWLMRNLQMFEVSNRGKKLEKISLYGDRVEIENITQALKEIAQLEVTIINPFSQLTNANKTSNIQHQSSYLLTVALATRQEVC